MRKLIATTLLAAAIATSALATPPNDSTDRGPRGIFARIVRTIKRLVRPMDDTGTIHVPIPSTTT